MYSFTSHLARSLALIAVLTVGLCSSVMNWRFGFQLGHTPIDCYVLGVFGVALDVVKWLAPWLAALAFAQKAYVRSVAAVLVWLACISWSFTAATGFSALNREAVATEHQAITNELENAQLRLKQANEDLALIPLESAMASNNRVHQCHNATLDRPVPKSSGGRKADPRCRDCPELD